MTRAQEKLIVTACIREDKPGASLRRIGLQQLAPDPYMELTQAGSALDWILGAALRHAASIPLRAEYGIPESGGEYDAYPLRFQRWDEASLAAPPAVQPQPAPAPEPSETPSALAAASSPADAPSGQDAASGTDASPGAACMSSRNPAPARIRVPPPALRVCPQRCPYPTSRACACRMRTASRSTTRRISPPARLSPPGRDGAHPDRRRALALHKFMQFSTTEARAGTAACADAGARHHRRSGRRPRSTWRACAVSCKARWPRASVSRRAHIASTGLHPTCRAAVPAGSRRARGGRPGIAAGRCGPVFRGGGTALSLSITKPTAIPTRPISSKVQTADGSVRRGRFTHCRKACAGSVSSTRSI